MRQKKTEQFAIKTTKSPNLCDHNVKEENLMQNNETPDLKKLLKKRVLKKRFQGKNGRRSRQILILGKNEFASEEMSWRRR